MKEADMIGWRTESMGQNTPFNKNSVFNFMKLLKIIVIDGESILDVGCYHGWLCEYLESKQKKIKYIGIDLFEKHIEQAKRNYPDEEFYVEDLFETSRQADVVVCSRVLMHIPNYEEAIRKLVSLAKRLCFIILALGEEESSIIEEGFVRKEHKVYFNTYRQKDVEAVLDETGCGYSIIKSKPYSMIMVKK